MSVTTYGVLEAERSEARRLDMIAAALMRHAHVLVARINHRLGEDVLYLTVCCGYFRLYGKRTAEDVGPYRSEGAYRRADVLLLEGNADVDGAARLVRRLQVLENSQTVGNMDREREGVLV